MPEEVGKRIGDYQILNELGSGGMGRVYKVRNVLTDRIEAMKILLPNLSGREDIAARFLREIKLMANLNHPNIAALRTAFTADNQLVMIMEFVEGTDLAARLEHGPIPPADAMNYIQQVLSALSYAHQQHVIHRDIKPSNMMLTPQRVVKLMDFGIARAGEERSITMTGTTLGSLGYMSPEQVKGEPTDARSDLYSVGVSLYEMVTGQRPFQASSDYSIMAAHVKETPKPPVELHPGLPAAMNEIIIMSIAKDPAQRFQTADAFRNALSSVHFEPAESKPIVLGKPDDVTVDTILPLAPQPMAAATPQPTFSAPAKTPPASVIPPKPSIPVPPPQPGGHRGLYMTLGALIVLAVLVAAGIYIPRRSKTEAGPKAASSDVNGTNASSKATPASNPVPANPPQPDAAAAPNPSGQVTAQPQASTPAVPAPENASPVRNAAQVEKLPVAHTHKIASSNGGSQDAATPAQDANASPAAPDAASLDAAERDADQLSNRAAAVNNSLDHLQQQQSAAGYGLRGDIAARQASMKNNLAKAQSAVQSGDLTRARKYMDLAQSDVDALEHFLGH
jgi:eukaryotic-like serine/threonine-protein kinase